MHSKENNKYVIAKELLSKLQSNDPKIVVKDDGIEIIPFYWNYSLVSNFIPIFVSIYIIISNIYISCSAKACFYILTDSLNGVCSKRTTAFICSYSISETCIISKM